MLPAIVLGLALTLAGGGSANGDDTGGGPTVDSADAADVSIRPAPLRPWNVLPPNESKP